MKLSVTTFPWRRIASPRELASILATIKGIGFAGVGLEYGYLPAVIKKKPELVEPIVQKSGLENGGTFSPGAMTRVEWARASGTPLIWVSIYSPDQKLALQKLSKFAEKAKENGVVASLHNEIRSAFQTPSQIRKAMNSIDNLTLCLDTAHGTAAGLDIERTIEEYAGRINLVHLKDFRSRIPVKDVRFTRDFVNVGHGIVNFERTIEKLKAVGYKGELMLEIEANEGQTPSAVVKEGFDYIRNFV
jgi:sugar phosphate isomerase/epimerase